MRRMPFIRHHKLVLIVLCLATLALGQSPQYEVQADKNVMVPMRDGTKLATDIYRPALHGTFGWLRHYPVDRLPTLE